jgi:hypothetical protein
MEPGLSLLYTDLWQLYIDIIATALDIIHRLVSYLKHTADNVRTSQEAHYVYTTSPTG